MCYSGICRHEQYGGDCRAETYDHYPITCLYQVMNDLFSVKKINPEYYKFFVNFVEELSEDDKKLPTNIIYQLFIEKYKENPDFFLKK